VKALVVVAHPVSTSLTRAAADRAVTGLESAGHEVTLLDLYAEGFAPAMSHGERVAYHSETPLISSDAIRAAELVRSSQILVFAYPTWWSDAPAIMRGFFERVFIPSVAFELDPGAGKVKPIMDHVSHLVGISTYGSPWTYVKIVHDNGRRMITRALRMCTGRRTKTTWLGLYHIDDADDAVLTAFLERIENTMAGLS